MHSTRATQVVGQAGDLERLADGRCQRVIAPDESMELIIEHIADRRLKRESFLLGAGRLDHWIFRHFEPGRPARRRPGILASGKNRLASPRALGGSGQTTSGRSRPAKSRREALEVRFLIRVVGRREHLAPKPLNALGKRLKDKTAPIDQIAARIDCQGHGRSGWRARDRIAIETVKSYVSHDQTRGPH